MSASKPQPKRACDRYAVPLLGPSPGPQHSYLMPPKQLPSPQGQVQLGGQSSVQELHQCRPTVHFQCHTTEKRPQGSPCQSHPGTARGTVSTTTLRIRRSIPPLQYTRPIPQRLPEPGRSQPCPTAQSTPGGVQEPLLWHPWRLPHAAYPTPSTVYRLGPGHP
jgi:hypothetical protein